MFQENKTAEPSFDKSACEDHFRDTYSDEHRDMAYTPPKGLKRPPAPTQNFGKKLPSRAVFNQILHKRPNKSSPGPNGIPYLVYKKLKCCADLLFLILRRIIKEQHVPRCFGLAQITLISKDPTNTKDVKLFRPIACLNVESKILWAILSQSLTSFLIANGYLKDRTQKGFLPNVAGCIEHSATLAEALRNAKDNLRTIVVNWIDLANAFGSVRHSLIQFSLEWYHVPNWCSALVSHYYSSLFAQVVTKK